MSEQLPKVALAQNAIPFSGGQGMNLVHMTRALSSRFALQVYAGGPVAEAPTEVIDSRAPLRRVMRLPGVRRMRDWSTQLEARSFDRQLAQALRPCAIFQGGSGYSLASMTRARSTGARTVLDCVTTHIDNVLEIHRRELPRFGMRVPVTPRLRESVLCEYAQADLLRVMSETAAGTFADRGYPAEKLVVVPPVVDLAEFESASFASDCFRVCHVGRMEPLRGFHYLIEAYRAVARSDTELTLWDGPSSRKVSEFLTAQSTAEPSIRIQPVEVRRHGYANVYGTASVFVHPSLADAYGYGVVEAMACGLPVIVTSTTGAAELIRDGVNGYVIPPADPSALAERLRHLMDHPGLLRSMGAAARQAVAGLTQDAFNHRYLPRLEALIG